MSNDHTLEQLREALLQEVASNPTAQEIEEFMSASTDASAGALDKMRKEFVEKVLHSLHPESVRQVERSITLGQWVEAERKKARLSHGFIATALSETPSFVERLEKGESLPWTISAAKGSDLAILFRIHFNAFSELVANSSNALVNLSNQTQEVTRSGQAPDAFPSKNLPHDVEMIGKIKDWLEAVRRKLVEKQAQYLLD